MADERTWADMTTAERLGVLAEGFFSTGKFTEEQQAQVMGRVAGYFLGGREWDFYDASNILLREAWRLEHDGDVSEWDASCRLSGTPVPTDPRADLLARKGEMTQEEFFAAERKLYAPEPVVAGRNVWEALVEREDHRGYIAVKVEWPVGGGTASVYVDGRKVNARQRRSWLRTLADRGVTRESVAEATLTGRMVVSAEG